MIGSGLYSLAAWTFWGFRILRRVGAELFLELLVSDNFYTSVLVSDDPVAVLRPVAAFWRVYEADVVEPAGWPVFFVGPGEGFGDITVGAFYLDGLNLNLVVPVGFQDAHLLLDIYSLTDRCMSWVATVCGKNASTKFLLLGVSRG